MKLLLDIGNTRCKWAVVVDGNIIHSDAFVLGDDNDLVKLLSDAVESNAFSSGALSDASLESFNDINVSSVRSAQSKELWKKAFSNVSNANVWFASVETPLHGFHIAYKNPKNLGVDRWLAMLAAKRRVNGASIIIDAGSAITVDYISDAGNHGGGLILPGVSMMVRALFSNTAAVKVEQLSITDKWLPGEDTLPCVSNAISAAMKGFFVEAVSGRSAKVLITGGDAKQLSKMLDCEYVLSEHLVLEGLLIASEDNNF